MEDSNGSAVASDRALWRNLLGSAKLLRERLSADPKSSCQLKPGCCEADPAFKQSLEVTVRDGMGRRVGGVRAASSPRLCVVYLLEVWVVAWEWRTRRCCVRVQRSPEAHEMRADVARASLHSVCVHE